MARTFEQTLSVTLDYQSEGTVYLTVKHTLPTEMTALALRFPDFVAVEKTEGFSRKQRHLWEWDGRTSSPWLGAVVNANRTRSNGYRFVDTGSWALVQFPPISASWKYTGSSIERKQVYEIDQEGVASSDGSLVYVGPYESTQFQAGGQLFHLVIPEAASLGESPAAIQASLTHAAESLAVGNRDDEVVVVAAPSSINWSAAGLQSGASGFWALDSSNVDRAGNTWIHEYVHTRQGWERDSSTEWLMEGTTNYYAALFTFRQGRIPFSTFYRHITTDQHGNSVLADPGSWTASNAHYTKGRRVTAALDAEIRQRTDGAASFQDVFRRLNDVSGSLTHDRFEQVVVDVGGPALADWLAQYVEGSRQPAVPKREVLFAPGGTVSTPKGGDDGPGGPGGHEPGDKPGEDGPGGVEEGDDEHERCPVCDGVVAAGDKYCGTCGTALFRQCPVCAYEVTDQQYCPECGTEIIESCDICGRRRHESEQYCSGCGTEF